MLERFNTSSLHLALLSAAIVGSGIDWMVKGYEDKMKWLEVNRWKSEQASNQIVFLLECGHSWLLAVGKGKDLELEVGGLAREVLGYYFCVNKYKTYKKQCKYFTIDSLFYLQMDAKNNETRWNQRIHIMFIMWKRHSVGAFYEVTKAHFHPRRQHPTSINSGIPTPCPC